MARHFAFLILNFKTAICETFLRPAEQIASNHWDIFKRRSRPVPPLNDKSANFPASFASVREHRKNFVDCQLIFDSRNHQVLPPLMEFSETGFCATVHFSTNPSFIFIAVLLDMLLSHYSGHSAMHHQQLLSLGIPVVFLSTNIISFDSRLIDCCIQRVIVILARANIEENDAIEQKQTLFQNFSNLIFIK